MFAFTAGGCTLLVTQRMAEGEATPPRSSAGWQRFVAMLAANRNRLSDKTKRHGYQAAYGPFLAPFIRKPIRLLEIADWYGERRVSEAVVQPLPKPAANVRDRLRRRRRQPGFHGVCA